MYRPMWTWNTTAVPLKCNRNWGEIFHIVNGEMRRECYFVDKLYIWLHVTHSFIGCARLQRVLYGDLNTLVRFKSTLIFYVIRQAANCWTSEFKQSATAWWYGIEVILRCILIVTCSLCRISHLLEERFKLKIDHPADSYKHEIQYYKTDGQHVPSLTLTWRCWRIYYRY
jgi:hypothetical protein